MDGRAVAVRVELEQQVADAAQALVDLSPRPAERLEARAVQHAAGVDDVVGRVQDPALVQAVGE